MILTENNSTNSEDLYININLQDNSLDTFSIETYSPSSSINSSISSSLESFTPVDYISDSSENENNDIELSSYEKYCRLNNLTNNTSCLNRQRSKSLNTITFSSNNLKSDNIKVIIDNVNKQIIDNQNNKKSRSKKISRRSNNSAYKTLIDDELIFHFSSDDNFDEKEIKNNSLKTEKINKIKQIFNKSNLGEEPYYETENGSPILNMRQTLPTMVIYDSDLIFAPSNSLASSQDLY